MVGCLTPLTNGKFWPSEEGMELEEAPTDFRGPGLVLKALGVCLDAALTTRTF